MSRSRLLLLAGVALIAVPGSGAAISVDATACSIDLHGRSGELGCTVPIPGGFLAFDGSPTLTTAVAEGETARYAYDTLGRLVIAHVEARPTAYQYDSSGRVAAVIEGDGDPGMYTYDELGRLLAAGAARFVHSDLGPVRAALADGSVVEYEYDSRGNLVSTTTDGGDGRFAYDERNRLVLAAVDGETTQYEYDDVRIVRRVHNGVVTEYSYDARGLLLRTSSSTGEVVEYSYDTSGSLERVSSAAATTSFSYDRAGRLSGIAESRGGKVGFEYAGGLLARVETSAGASVIVDFEMGDPNEPLVLGYVYGDADGQSFSLTLRGRLRTCRTCP